MEASNIHFCLDSSLWKLIPPLKPGERVSYYCWVEGGWEFKWSARLYWYHFLRRGRSASLLLLIHCQCGETGLVSPGSCVYAGPHLTFSDTHPTEALEHLISTKWVWKSRLLTQTLQAEWRLRPQFFFCGMWLEQSNNYLKVSILGGCSFSILGVFSLFFPVLGATSTGISGNTSFFSTKQSDIWGIKKIQENDHSVDPFGFWGLCEIYSLLLTIQNVFVFVTYTMSLQFSCT